MEKKVPICGYKALSQAYSLQKQIEPHYEQGVALPFVVTGFQPENSTCNCITKNIFQPIKPHF
jgi:hypothetical protein